MQHEIIDGHYSTSVYVNRLAYWIIDLPLFQSVE